MRITRGEKGNKVAVEICGEGKINEV